MIFGFAFIELWIAWMASRFFHRQAQTQDLAPLLLLAVLLGSVLGVLLARARK